MIIEQSTWCLEAGWKRRDNALNGKTAQFVLAFGGRHLLENPARYQEVRDRYPGAHVVLTSTAGEITDTEVTEDHLSVTAVHLEKSRVSSVALTITSASESYAVGAELARRLDGPEIVHVLVISDGALTNGTELARGLNEKLNAGVLVTGGLAGDGDRFQKPLVGLNEMPVSGRVVALAFYGVHFKSSSGSCGGWAAFGPERVVTQSDGNQLVGLDGQSALELYKKYLGDQASGLPGAALRFPLSLSPMDGSPSVVRTILSIDEATQSMTFAGDIPTGARVRLMRASYEDLLDGATNAANQANTFPCELVLCISCVGRRIVLGQRTEEEVELVREAFGGKAAITGFYSYGELAPTSRASGCQLHNQTMTITGFAEE